MHVNFVVMGVFFSLHRSVVFGSPVALCLVAWGQTGQRWRRKGCARVAAGWPCGHPPPPSFPRACGDHPPEPPEVSLQGDGTVTSLLGGDKGAVCSARSLPPYGLVGLRVSSLQTRGAPSFHLCSHAGCRQPRSQNLYFFPFYSYKILSLS